MPQQTPYPLSSITLVSEVTDHLEITLRSLDWIDERIVVLTDSVNQTQLKNVLKKVKNVTVITAPQKGPITDFSQVRNWASNQAKNQTVFHVDSDETVSPNLAQSIQEHVTHEPATLLGMRRQDIFHGKLLEYSEGGNSWHVRLYNRQCAHWQGSVHETLISELSPVWVQGSLIHHAHTDLSEFFATVHRYSYLAAEKEVCAPLWLTCFKMAFYPPGKLLYGLFCQGAILDGWRGVSYTWLMCFHSLCVRLYAYEMKNKKSK